jgi:Lrp/AsnC family leucine-responsive transcriptional regulator
MATRLNIAQSLDQKDRGILALVQRDAKLAQAEIARQVGLSTAAVNERLRKLENAGVIRRYAAIVDPPALGVSLTAFVEVFIEHPRHEAGFFDQILKLDQVLECHHITGEFSVLLKIRVRDMAALQDLLLRRLNAIEGVRQTRTVMVLSTQKEDCFVSPAETGGAP